MNDFWKAAVNSVQLLYNQKYSNPREAWESATSRIFGKGTSSQVKGCPRNAFLGLCEAGLVKDIRTGNYTRSKVNKQYAVDAVSILRKQPKLANDPFTLWGLVLGGVPKSHNHQMDVVTALWNHILIV